MPAHPSAQPERVELLASRVPAATRSQILDVLGILDAFGPVVLEALRRILPLANAVATAAEAVEAEPISDQELDALLERLDTNAMWTWADALAHAHPDVAAGEAAMAL